METVFFFFQKPTVSRIKTVQHPKQTKKNITVKSQNRNFFETDQESMTRQKSNPKLTTCIRNSPKTPEFFRGCSCWFSGPLGDASWDFHQGEALVLKAPPASPSLPLPLAMLSSPWPSSSWGGLAQEELAADAGTVAGGVVAGGGPRLFDRAGVTTAP